ncbi:MAG: 50S ribosomal protein L13 [Candidatus Neomarinimicrobiota bacterium]|nr:50S ribosomal protein L13 [Candidatus Neomarinimicrobiota bacterium]MEC9006996.1 50S ribosomal protein L13 [Candidatus Neomarinimicrobiota bacterium]MEC9474584.1 50S ribosomal protein L13 [Candidatus Neomarinimicrobiota bacterium]MED5248735.1 50S ribosomal protein L13 [Candidatus Neomarinimicrobiota bacterium]MED5433355.1 50S ribosomal protein L13 [Candidatus Neomarinimicrobiota bacterium]|tara:strand:- start:912 stop:1340 length:429 start_codon:yes stop_codon:yes gene_type:complete
MKTKSLKSDEINKDWYIANAEGKTLGRLASQIAKVLRGKHKPSFTPHMDMGDFVVVVNAEKVTVSGKKESDKTYFKHSGYIGSTTFTKLDQMRRSHPERIVEKAVWGMLPKNRLGRAIIKHLKVYQGPEHPHEAQQPKELNI